MLKKLINRANEKDESVTLTEINVYQNLQLLEFTI